MNKIRKTLNNDYKYTKKTLLPTLFITKNIEDKKFNYDFEDKDILEHSILIDNLLLQIKEKLNKNFFF